MEEFEPATPASDCVSLRARCVAAGMDEHATREALRLAHCILTSVPGVNIRRFNPARPMQGVHSG